MLCYQQMYFILLLLNLPFLFGQRDNKKHTISVTPERKTIGEMQVPSRRDTRHSSPVQQIENRLKVAVSTSNENVTHIPNPNNDTLDDTSRIIIRPRTRTGADGPPPDAFSSHSSSSASKSQHFIGFYLTCTFILWNRYWA